MAVAIRAAMQIPKFTRREFCINSISLVTIASVIEACGGSSPTSPSGSGSPGPTIPMITASVANGAIALNIDSGSPLSSAGSAALVRASGNEVLVSRTGPNGFTAVTAICTHEGCTITGFEGQTYTCPCHFSQYSTSGAVLRGPATRPLRQFTTSFANNVLTITL